MNKLILGVIVSLLVGTGIGYVLGSGSGDMGMNKKDAEASIAMMKDQAAAIQKMSAMMNDAGVSLEGWSTKYGDSGMMMMSKDMKAVSQKYMKETENANTGSMKGMMGN